MEKFGIYMLKKFNETAIIHRQQTYLKVLVVRHPFDWLVSGYKENLAGERVRIEHKVGSDILKEMHPGIDQATIHAGRGVTFGELVK